MERITEGAIQAPPIATVLERLLEAPLRRPRHVLAPFVLVAGAIVGASYLVEKEYESSTVILVERERVPESFVPRVVTPDAPNQRLLTIKQEILSRTRLEQILNELKPYPELAGRVPLTRLVERLRQATTIAVKGNDAFTVQFVHPDPRMAKQVADRLATLFIDETLRTQGSRTAEATQFIESLLAEASRELEAREQAQRRFKEQHMGTLPEQTGSNLATLQRLQLEQQSVASSLQAALDRLQALELNPVGAPAPAPATAAGTAPGTLDQLLEELSNLRRRYTDEHPDVRALLARIEGLDKPSSAPAPANPPANLRAAQLAAARQDVERLQARSQSIDRHIAEVQARVEQAPRTEQQLATLTRDFQKLNQNYLSLLDKKLDAQMARRLEERWKGERFRILDPAYLPEQPISPDRIRFAVVGVLLGLVAGLGLAVGVEFLDRSVKSAAELQDAVPFPVVATISHIKAPTASRSRPVAARRAV